jgi:hypothetical protein
MGQINKNKKEIRILHIDDEEEVSRYCHHCMEYGFYNKLGPKIIIRGEKPTPDHDKWCQCYSCGKVYARHETTPEERIKGIIPTIENPFDQGKNIVGLDNKKKKTGLERERQKVLDKIEEEKDEDIKEALRHRNTVKIIE